MTDWGETLTLPPTKILHKPRANIGEKNNHKKDHSIKHPHKSVPLKTNEGYRGGKMEYLIDPEQGEAHRSGPTESPSSLSL